jgi:valyl-tRNA synthetase
MRNIRDWCISRQLWWGHRIPAFTCANGHLTVSETDPKACETCGSEALEQDPDVLDTWFSSQLWPFSVFGWPEETEDYREFYPTDTLVTGYDILFFWVARMIMAGIHFTGRAPFSVVHLHGLVRVGGEKMSKTRGNVIDPLEAIGEFGADAVRFTLAAAAASGPTVSVERGRMAGSRNFATKLWNAARFTLGQLEDRSAARSLEGLARSLPDRWILSRLNATAQAVNRNLAGFRFDEAAQAVYAFLWHELCDGYLEMVKPLLGPRAGDEAAKETARAVLARCLSDSLALLHPFMPFVTEEIWEKMTGRPGSLIVAPYPQGEDALRDEPAEKVVEAMRAIVTRVRNFRTERGFSPTEPVLLAIDPDSPDRGLAGEIATLAPLLRHMARLSDLSFGPPSPGMGRDVVEGLSIGLSVAQSEAGVEGGKIARTLAALDEEIAELSAKLHNTSFLDKAPPVVVDKTRRRLIELEERRSALSTAGA